MAKESQLPLSGLDAGQLESQKDSEVKSRKGVGGPKTTLNKWRVNKITQLVQNGVHLENVAAILDIARATLFKWLQFGRDIREALEAQVGKTLDVEKLVVEAERKGKDSQLIDTLKHIRAVGQKDKHWICVELHDAVEKAKFALAEKNRPTTLPQGKAVSEDRSVKQELTVTKPATFYARLWKAVSVAVVHLEHCPKPDNPIFAATMQRDIQELKDAAAGLEEIQLWMDGKGVLKD